MPIKHAICKVGPKPSPLPATTLLNEQQLEEMTIVQPGVLSALVAELAGTLNNGKVSVTSTSTTGRRGRPPTKRQLS